jgi:hypothetical protein
MSMAWLSGTCCAPSAVRSSCRFASNGTVLRPSLVITSRMRTNWPFAGHSAWLPSTEVRPVVSPIGSNTVSSSVVGAGSSGFSVGRTVRGASG